MHNLFEALISLLWGHAQKCSDCVYCSLLPQTLLPACHSCQDCWTSQVQCDNLWHGPCGLHWPQRVTHGSLTIFFLFPLIDPGHLLLLVPTRAPSRPSSTRGPSGSSTAPCLGDCSSLSSHTNPKLMARSPFTVVTESKVSVHLLSSASGAAQTGATWSSLALSVDPLGGNI